MRGTPFRLLGVCVMALLHSTTPAVASGDVRLVDAAKERDAAAIELLVRDGVDVNSTHPDGATALLWAAQWNDLGLADVLIRAGPNLDLPNDYGVTPLSMACLNASVEMVDKLLSAGASPNSTLLTGETALMTATRTGSLEVVELLLARGAEVNARETYHEQTALMWALAGSHLDIAHALIERGADALTPSLGGFSPLMFAARAGNIDAVKLLLAHGADVNETVDPTTEGLSPGLSVLHVATLRGHAELAVFLLDRGANPNADGPGYTALHWAAWFSESYMTKDYPDAGGEWAAVGGIPTREGKLRVIEALLANGAALNPRATALPTFGHDIYGPILRGGGDLMGATPFLLAASVGDIDVMRLLLAAGADPTLGTNNNTSPLLAAAGLARWPDEASIPETSHLRAVELCLEIVCGDLAGANDEGNTPLHAAALSGFNEIVRSLVEKGHPLSPKNKPGKGGARGAKGLTPMQAAADMSAMFGGQPETAALLRELGAVE